MSVGQDAATVLDVSCGIGTQAIGLGPRGCSVTASDLSDTSVARVKTKAQLREVEISYSVCDMRAAHSHHLRQFNVVVSADNSITHLLNDDDLPGTWIHMPPELKHSVKTKTPVIMLLLLVKK